MDSEADNISAAARYKLEQTLKQTVAPSITLEQAEAEQGMPWKESVGKVQDEENPLLYMKFWEWQMDFMKENLTDLRVVSCTNSDGKDFSFNINNDKKARIVNICATSKEYRKIRMTYYDAGDATQVFNSVWYPDPEYNLPVLGADLLAFGRKKYLAIVDFQPLHEVESDHSQEFEHLLEPIKSEYDALKGKMSSKFYDETQFFSQQMLFSRFEDEQVVDKELFPAFKQYVQTHLDLVRSTDRKPEEVNEVLDRQQAYDTYSAERDPATGLFAAMFGKDWAEDFVHDFLFSMSIKNPNFEIQMGPPGPPGGKPQGGGGNPYAQQGKSPAKVAVAER